jgi:hypothetical protein
VTISWRADASCPRPATLEADVARRLGSEPIDPSATAIAIVVAPHLPEPYELTLSVADAGAERRVLLGSCAEVERAAALLIATALAPARAQQVEQSELTEEPAPRPPLRWSVRIGALFDLRSLPGPSAGPQLGVELARAHLRLFSDARYLVPRSFQDEGSALRAGVDLWAVTLGGAYTWSLGSFALGPCLEAELGAQRARARGARASGSTFGPWASAWLGLASEYAGFRRFAITLAATVGTPLWRSEFELTDPMNRFRSEALSFRVQAGLRFALGAKNPDEGGQ